MGPYASMSRNMLNPLNLCKNKIRTQARRPDSEPMEDQEKLEKASADLYGDEQSSVAHQETLESLNKALESLPEIYQQILTLRYLGKMSGQQISRFLDPQLNAQPKMPAHPAIKSTACFSHPLL